MALQFVGGLTTGFNGVTPTGSTITVSLASLTGGLASAPSIGDVVFVAYAANSNTDRRTEMTIASGDGFTYTQVSSLYSGSASAAQTSLRVAYRRLTTTDASLVLGNISNATAAGLTVSVHVWRGVHPTTPIDTTPITGTFGTGASTPNISFSSIVPITAGAVVLVAGAGGGTSVVYSSSDLSNFRTVRQTNTYQSVNGLGSYAWTSGVYTPANWTGGSTGYVGGSYAWTMLAIRPAGSAQSLSPSLFTNNQTFPSPIFNRGPVSLAASLVANGQTFYSPTVANGQITLQPALLNNVQSFLSPIVSSKAALSPALLSNGQGFYDHSVTPGTISLAPLLISSTASIFAPALAAQALTLLPGRLDNGQSFYEVTVGPGPVFLAASLLDSSSLLHAPSLFSGSVSLLPGLLSGEQAFYGLVVSVGPVVLTPPSLNNAQEFFPATAAASALMLRPSILDNGSALHPPVLSVGAVSLLPARVEIAQAFFAPDVIAGGRVLLPGQISNAQVFFAPSVLLGPALIEPSLLVNRQEFAPASLTPGAVALSPLLLYQVQQFYAVTVKSRMLLRFGAVSVRPAVDGVSASAQVARTQVAVMVDGVAVKVIDPPASCFTGF